MSRTWAGRIFISRPIRMVPKMPPATMHTMTTSMGAPRETMSESTSCRPRKTIPNRSSFLEASVSPGAVDSGRRTTLVRAMPSTIATISGLTPGRKTLTVIAIATATAHKSNPGEYFFSA